MSDRRSVSADVLALVVFIVGLVVAVSVLGHEPAAATTYPSHSHDDNLLGEPGGWLASHLYDALGSAVLLIPAAWFVLVLALVLPDSKVWWKRLAGWLILLPAGAVVADRIGPEYIEGPKYGSGGILGAWLTGLLDRHCVPLIANLLTLVPFSAGILLALDFVVNFVLQVTALSLKTCGLLLRTIAVGFAGACRWLFRRRPRRKKLAAQGDVTNSDTIPISHAAEAENLQEEESEEEEPEEEQPLTIHRPTPVIAEIEQFADFELPPIDLLNDPPPFPFEEHDQLLRATASLLEKTFNDFNLNVKVVGINTGPVITQYEVSLETGLRVNKVTNLSDDLALNLKVPSVRVVAPIPGKNTVGIEVPNEHRAVVCLKEVLQGAGKKITKAKLPLFLGKDTEGRPLVYDLADMPHLLIAGRTGTGKSVCMNAIILSMLMTRRPDEVKMIMIDPKMLELSEYGRIPHLMHPVVKDMRKAEAILAWAVDKMEERYDLLARARVRSIASYNTLDPQEIRRRVKPDEAELERIPDRMPYIVIVVDEMNDLMMQMKREVEGHIIRLAQKSRAAGIHLVVATQKPTVDVITGLIKSNLPARICFQVASRSDSRVVLDEIGAEKLLGKGDMLFLQPGTSTVARAQGTFASDEEITSVVEHLECDPCYVQELVELKTSNDAEKGDIGEKLRARDELYEPAVEVVIREGRGSVSLLQRALGIGYGRAARLIDFMAEDGIVGAYNGSSAREVLYSPEEWEEMKEAKAAG